MKRLLKKFNSKNAKYKVIKVIGSHSYRLNIPPGIRNVFYSRLLRPVVIDPLLS
jgi:hypothetical protein